MKNFKLYKTDPAKLPMSTGQPDFVFADEKDGVVAVKKGEKYFYASPYWRTRNAVNFLGRVHLIQPQYDRIATIYEEEVFEPSGMLFSCPDYTSFGFAKGSPKYPDTTHSAHAGEQLPIAMIPAGITFQPGEDSPYAGKASIYKMVYENYFAE